LDPRVSHAGKQQKQVTNLLFDPEDGDDVPQKCLAVSELHGVTIQFILTLISEVSFAFGDHVNNIMTN
jgi:hypothetical protein